MRNNGFGWIVLNLKYSEEGSVSAVRDPLVKKASLRDPLAGQEYNVAESNQEDLVSESLSEWSRILCSPHTGLHTRVIAEWIRHLSFDLPVRDTDN